MADDIKIGIASDTKAFEAGTKSGVLRPLENIGDALEDTGDAGKKAGDQLEDGFDTAGESATDLGRDAKRGGDDIEAAMRDAQNKTQALEKEYRELATTVTRESRDAGRDLKKNLNDGTDAAKEGLQEVGEEAAGTARETAASFDGSAESITGAFQEVAANAFAGFGPAGMIAGLGAAAGIGLVVAAFDTAGQKADEMAEDTATAYDQMIEAGGRYLTVEAQNSAIQDVIKDKWKQLKEIADLTGLSVSDVARGYALGGTELEGVKDKLLSVYDANNALIMTGEGFTDTLVDQNKTISEQVEALKRVNGVQESAVEMANVYDEATGGAMRNRAKENEEIQKRNQSLANTPATVSTKLTVDDSALKAAIVQKSINVVLNAVDQFGKKIK